MKQKIAILAAVITMLPAVFSGYTTMAGEYQMESADTEIVDTVTDGMETNDIETNDIETDNINMSDMELFDIESDDFRKENHETKESETEMQYYESQTEESDFPEIKIPEMEIPETELIETEFIETELIQTEIMETEIMYTETMESDSAQTDTPKNDVPDTEEFDTESTNTVFTETETDESELMISDGSQNTDSEDILQTNTEDADTDIDIDQPAVYAEKGILSLEVSRTEGSIPVDVALQLRSLEDMAAEEDDPDQAKIEYQEILLTSLYEEIAEQYQDHHIEYEYSEELLPYMYEVLDSSVMVFESVELQFLYQDGSSYDPGEIDVKTMISDPEVYNRVLNTESVLVPVWYDESLKVRIPGKSEYSVSESDCKLHISLSPLYHPSFYAVAEIDRSKVECLYEAAVQLKEEQMYMDSTESESSEADVSEGSVFAYTQPGTLCKSSSSYTKVSQGSRTFSSAYTFLRGTSKSVCTMWYDSSTVLKGYQENSGMEYLMPKSSDAKGNFGFRITNVGYNTSARCNLDLYVTVTKFKTFSLDIDGKRVNGVYPFVHMNKDLAIYYQQGLPAFELRCDIVKSGTTEKVAGNYRFMWIDIDGAQRYGFLPVNGKLDARYCMNTSTVACGTETQFKSDYHMLYGQADSAADTNTNCSVLFETSNMSSFKIYVGQSGDGTSSYTHTKETILKRYEDAADGVYNANTKAKLCWSGKAYGPTALPSPLTKYTGNTAGAWNSSNTLPSVTSEYWYAFEIFIPDETSEYYYSEYQIKDALPGGVDYVGDFSVQKIETGEAVDSFSVSQTNDIVTVSAKASSLTAASFYGFTYRIQFKVKMDPTEMNPSYNGTTAVYTVKNQAVQTGKHKSDSAVTSVTSNTVSTTASEKRPGINAPSKWIQTNSGLIKDRELDSRNDRFVYEIQQNIPVKSNAWTVNSLEITDQLAGCLEVKEIAVYQNTTLCGTWTATESGTSKKGWKCDISGQNIRITTANAMPDGAYNTTVRLMIQAEIREDADLSAYAVSGTPEFRIIEIPNQASSVFTWNNGSPVTETQKSNSVLIRLTEELLSMSRITLTKSILAEEIVWAHGNPVFTFCIEGTDKFGNAHKYYDTVEFTRENTPADGTVTGQAVFDLPSGSYRAYETNVIRYHLSAIDGIKNGSAAGVGVNFTIRAEQQGTATFHNRKTTDEYLSDTVFIRNTIIK